MELLAWETIEKKYEKFLSQVKKNKYILDSHKIARCKHTFP